MGEVVKFRAKKFTGLIPDEIGQMAMEYLEQQRRARDLVLYAKRGAPPNLTELHPDDCA